MTISERRCLQFIREYIALHGHSPMLKEIAGALGHKYHGSVRNILDSLIEQGAISRERCRKRGLRLPEAA